MVNFIVLKQVVDGFTQQRQVFLIKGIFFMEGSSRLLLGGAETRSEALQPRKVSLGNHTISTLPQISSLVCEDEGCWM